MSVIGRLDKQVEDVIISPVSKRHGDGGPARHDAGEAPPPEAPPTAQTPEEVESSADRGELPVWLL